MKMTKIYRSLLALAAPFMLAACGNEGEPNVPVVEEEFEGIVLNVPISRGMETRVTDDPATTTEAAIKNLWIFAYAQEENGELNGTTYIAQVTGIGDWNNNPPISDYKSVPLKIKPGKYHIYLLANIAPSDLSYTNNGSTATPSVFASLTETQLQGARLKYELSDGTIKATTGIPMSADYSVMKKSKTEKYTNGLIEIKAGKSSPVYADLTFCVAKVRFTLLNNENSEIDMAASDPIQVANSAKEVGLLSEITVGDSQIKNTTTITGGKKYVFPSTITAENISSWQGADLSSTSEAADNATEWAYQTTFYVPEHLWSSEGENVKKTTLKVNLKQKNMNKEFVIGDADNKVERSHFYEFFGYVDKRAVTFKASVKAWVYHKTKIIELDE